jgi:hypothetical protein
VVSSTGKPCALAASPWGFWAGPDPGEEEEAMKSTWKVIVIALTLPVLLVSFGPGCQDDGGPTGSTARAVECADDGTCPSGEACVRGYCMPDCASDADCPAGVCVAGVCEFEPEPWACAADSDCPAGTSCTGGACVADPGTCTPVAEVCNGFDDDCDGLVDEVGCTCPEGQTLCGAVCVDAQFDEVNCGGCGMLCALGETCLGGVCTGGVACASAADCDDGDPATSDVCLDGTCAHEPACVPSIEICNGVDDDCDGLVDDGVHCDPPCVSDADCDDGRFCTTESCVSGACVVLPDIPCDDGDPATFDVCDEATDTCTHGSCVPVPEVCNGLDDDCDGVVDEEGCTCAPGETLCGAVCVDTGFDESNCGACGVACPAGQTCELGVCTA